MWSWIVQRNEPLHVTDFTDPPAFGWSGIMSLPRTLTWNSQEVLIIEPVEELQRLRLRKREEKNIRVSKDEPIRLRSVEGNTLDLLLTIDPNDAEVCGIKVCASPDGQEETTIEYNRESAQLTIDLEKSGLDESIKYYQYVMYSRGDNPRVTKQEAPLKLNPDEKLELRIFIDRSIVEVFANKRQCMTQCIYPTRQDSQGVELFVKGGSMLVESFEAWDIAATNHW